jgi:hypothetical protein
MLARTPSCVECGLPWGAPTFRHEDEAPLYWSDTGLLCSASCAQSHFAQRHEDGTFVAVPAECPVEI